MPTAEVCRRHGLSPASSYKVKAKYGGMKISDTHRLRSLEGENANTAATFDELMFFDRNSSQTGSSLLG